MKQSSTGDFSPNVTGDNNSFVFETKSKINPADEVKTMLAVVNLIPVVAQSQLDQNEVKFEYGTKDLHEKFDVRFKDFSVVLKARIVELSLLYRGAYEETKNISDVGEFDYEILLDRLRQLSIKALEETNGKPVEALARLVDWFCEQFKQQEENYSIGAVEYFLYMELMQCNVFPNISK